LFSKITIDSKAQDDYYIHHLADGFGLLLESNWQDSCYFVTLIALDLHAKIVHKFETVEIRGREIKVVVNKDEPTEFVLGLSVEGEIFVHFCKVVKTKIVVGNAIRVSFIPQALYNGHLYALGMVEYETDVRRLL
jgi:hypothetical protein